MTDLIKWINKTLKINKKYREDATLETVHEFYMGRVDALMGVIEQ